MRVVVTMNPAGGDVTRRLVRAVYYALLGAGIIAFGFVGYSLLDRYWYESVEMSRFEAVSKPAGPGPVVEPHPVPEGGVIGEIEAPRLGLKAIVVQGDSAKLLRRAVGHLPETALPGEPGNVTLAGHRDGLFRPLREARPGDSIILRTPGREFRYQVEWTAVVSPTAVPVIEPTAEPALTLVTCFPFYYVGAAPKRFVVRARELASAP